MSRAPSSRAAASSPGGARIRIGLVGYGKIARDQHMPTIRAGADFELVACATHGPRPEAIPTFRDVEEMLDAVPGIEAVAVCTPPQARFTIARAALAAGRSVLLEKPPSVEVGELEELTEMARERSLALFAAWHSRHAPAVEPARRALAGRRVRRASIVWRENVREWHPGQAWIWQSGGLGVFDPGINALSIVTALLPGPLEVVSTELSTPANCETPIAAQLRLRTAAGAEVSADFDWREPGDPHWDIRIETDAGALELSRGGAALRLAERDAAGRDAAVREIACAAVREYASLYERFATLVRERAIDADPEPLRLACRALAIGRRRIVEPFIA